MAIGRGKEGGEFYEIRGERQHVDMYTADRKAFDFQIEASLSSMIPSAAFSETRQRNNVQLAMTLKVKNTT